MYAAILEMKPRRRITNSVLCVCVCERVCVSVCCCRDNISSGRHRLPLLLNSDMLQQQYRKLETVPIFSSTSAFIQLQRPSSASHLQSHSKSSLFCCRCVSSQGVAGGWLAANETDFLLKTLFDDLTTVCSLSGFNT